MLSGRHLLLLGSLAGAGLVSVRDSQRQIGLAYETARLEIQLHKLRQEAETDQAKLQALRAPPRVVDRVAGMRLDLAPASGLALYTPAPEPPKTAAPLSVPVVRRAGR